MFCDFGLLGRGASVGVWGTGLGRSGPQTLSLEAMA